MGTAIQPQFRHQINPNGFFSHGEKGNWDLSGEDSEQTIINPFLTEKALFDDFDLQKRQDANNSLFSDFINLTFLISLYEDASYVLDDFDGLKDLLIVADLPLAAYTFYLSYKNKALTIQEKVIETLPTFAITALNITARVCLGSAPVISAILFSISQGIKTMSYAKIIISQINNLISNPVLPDKSQDGKLIPYRQHKNCFKKLASSAIKLSLSIGLMVGFALSISSPMVHGAVLAFSVGLAIYSIANLFHKKAKSKKASAKQNKPKPNKGKPTELTEFTPNFRHPRMAMA